MAKLNTTLPLDEVKKAMGKLLLVKQYKGKIVIAKYPDMGKVKPSKKQEESRTKFKEAIHYAQTILKDPAQKELYRTKVKADQPLYLFLLCEYLQSH